MLPLELLQIPKEATTVIEVLRRELVDFLETITTQTLQEIILVVQELVMVRKGEPTAPTDQTTIRTNKIVVK